MLPALFLDLSLYIAVRGVNALSTILETVFTRYVYMDNRIFDMLRLCMTFSRRFLLPF